MITVWVMNGVMNAGGTESLIMDIFRHRGGNVSYFMIVHTEAKQEKNGVWDEEIRALGIPIYYLPSAGSVGVASYTCAFMDLVQEIGKPDIVHSHLNAVGGVIAKAAKKCDIKCRIVHCHANITYHGSKAQRMQAELKLFLMKLFVNRYANYYWACSLQAAERLFYPKKDKTIIPNVISTKNYFFSKEKQEAERTRLGISPESLVAGMIGRVVPIKNHCVIIKAIAKLRQQGMDVQLVCYGRKDDAGYFDTLIELAQSNKIDDAVHFMGNDNNIPQRIAAFDLLVMPSFSEGFGIAALEAQAAGLRVLASTGVPKETDVGLNLIEYLDPNESEDWSNAIRNVQRVRPDNECIEQAFRKKGYDAKDAVAMIEKKYSQMSQE